MAGGSGGSGRASRRVAKTAALLAGLEGGVGPRADAGASEGSTAGGGAVGIAKAGTTDELGAVAVANVLGTRRVGREGTRMGEDSGGDWSERLV